MNRQNTIRRLLRELTGKYRLYLILVFVLILINTFANVASSFFIKTLVDNLIPPLLAQASPVYDPLIKAIALMAVVYGLGVLTAFVYNRVMVSISQGVQKSIRDKLFDHLQSLPISYFDTHSHGDIMSHFTNDIDNLREFFSQSLPQLISSLFTVIMVLISMLLLSPSLTLVALVFALINLSLTRKLGGMAARHFIRQQQQVGHLNGYIKEMIEGQRVIKVFSHEPAVIKDFDEKNETLRGLSFRANRLTNRLMPIVMNVGVAQYAATALIGGMLAINGLGGVTLGAIAAFLTLTRTFNAPIGRASAQVNAVTLALAGSSRIFKLMDEEPESDEGSVSLVNAERSDGELCEGSCRTGLWAWRTPNDDGSFSYTELKGDVRFVDVNFGYSPGKPVLHQVSLYAKPGQKIAFVGATGAGKTTITNLINRFYDISDGQISYDGIDISRIKKADLRRSLGIVLQDTHLFTGSVADNIRYGKLDASDEEVRRAALTAGADGFIRRLPQGYDTMLSGDGGNLSGGQRQLIAIARAAVADPPVMILDEATSSIDSRTEVIVQRGMDRLMEGRTVFVIAHRLSTVRNSKAIMVLDQGRIIERGSHEELLAQKGRYYQLYTGSTED